MLYHALGAGYVVQRDPARAMPRMTKEANSPGRTIHFEPIAAHLPNLSRQGRMNLHTDNSPYETSVDMMITPPLG